MAPHHVSIHESPLLQPAVSGCLPTLNWASINNEFRSQIAMRAALACEELGVEEAGEFFSKLLASHLHRCETYRTTNEGEERRKKVVQSQPEAIPIDAVRLHNRARKASKRATISSSARKQERVFRENPWSFSKSVCCPNSQANPSFTTETGLNHFQSSFVVSIGPQYSSLPAWPVEEVMPHPEITSNFDMSPVTPGLIRKTL